jgi:methylmalonyl-CoA mutase cobalamin-binding domain/chain
MLPGKMCSAPVRNLIPGKQLGEDDLYQIDERELFSRDDYDIIADAGWNNFWDMHYEKMSGKPLEKFTMMQTISNQLYVEDTKICEEAGAPITLGVAVDSVLMAFSLSRTLTEFTKDLREAPDKVEAAMNAACDDLIANAVELCKKNDKMMAFIVLERGSGFYYRTHIFERFEWPFLQRYVDAFVSEGILPWLHLDTDWGMNIPYFKKLPRAKCVCDLDSTTDIFRAKEILGDHMCISGDVPAALLSVGTPKEVEAYCKRLIDEVGAGGGFMLTTGCECPVDVKAENLRAMVETGKNYRGKSTGVKRAEVKEEEEIVEAILPESGIGKALAELELEEVEAQVVDAVAAERDPLTILDELRAGMEVVGSRYSTGEYFLSDLILSADIFKNAVSVLEPHIKKEGKAEGVGTVVIGTPKGDIHDIGKNITATLFSVSGFTVRDLGVDVEPQLFIDAVKETDAAVVAMSALITPTFESMKKVVELLKEEGLRDDRYVIIGGGPTTETVRNFVGADAWTLNPKKGVDMSRRFVEERA